MQTFLPYRDFTRTAAVLDGPRLGKQRVETLQVLRALELPEYGWGNHPAVRMWRGRTPALVVYGLTVVREWRARGHADTTDALIAEFAPDVAGATQADLEREGLLPAWLGDGRVHVSHRSALVRKAPEVYRPVFGDVPDDLPYFWPDPDPGAPVASPVDRNLWVVRAPTAGWRERFLREGFVALGEQSGIGTDVGSVDRAELRAVLAASAPRRRPGKDLRMLEALVHELAPGDHVATPLDGGRELAVGVLTGDYRFCGHGGPAPGGAPEAEPVLPHRRGVRWQDTLPRAAVHPPATMQDPRPLFRVHVPGLVREPARGPGAPLTAGGAAPARPAG